MFVNLIRDSPVPFHRSVFPLFLFEFYSICCVSGSFVGDLTDNTHTHWSPGLQLGARVLN